MNARVVAGIDIGGARKGNHIVVMRGVEILASTRNNDPGELLGLCLQMKVEAVGIDAPCCWGIEGCGRLAEKELARQGISCFATPTLERASSNPSGFYGWMLNGALVFETFTPRYPLLQGIPPFAGPVSFETFPHAITCALLGRETASAKQKRTQRRDLLAAAGIDVSRLRSIDALDAALCALTASHLLEGSVRLFGNAETGFIVVPNTPHQIPHKLMA
jgi:predicted nuclease with RNAse H fold